MSHLLLVTRALHFLLQMLSSVHYFSTPSSMNYYPLACLYMPYRCVVKCSYYLISYNLGQLFLILSIAVPLSYQRESHHFQFYDHALSEFLSNRPIVLRQQKSKVHSASVLYQEQSVKTSTPELWEKENCHFVLSLGSENKFLGTCSMSI